MSEESNLDLTEDERAVLKEVVNSGDKGVFPEEIAEKLNMGVEKVEKILASFEEAGWFFSEEEEE